MVYAGPAAAQGQFSPELQVGNEIVTRHQIDQRARFLGLLGAPGDTRALARDQLINETLQLSAARLQGIEVTPEAIEAGITEFAARTNLTAEQFLEITQSRGISPATVRDFFTAGVAWRDTIRARFGESARATITEDQSARVLARFGTEGGTRVLVSEILLPANTPETTLASRQRAADLSALTSEAAFEAAARRVSIAPSSAQGGALDWVALDQLPEAVRGVITRLRPGQVSQPVTLENAIGVFLLRDTEVVAAGRPDDLLLDYALFTVTGGQSAAETVADQIDTCDDFYGLAQGLPEDRLIRETKDARALPADIRRAVQGLDENEATTALERGGNATVLMLCARTLNIEGTTDLEIAGNRLLNARLGASAAHYLSELRADANVVDLTTN